MADTVTGLGNFTFSGCQNAAFTLPETLQRLGAYVFENCKSLHTITLPRNVVQVGTGEVLALASYPTYDLETFNQNYEGLAQHSCTPGCGCGRGGVLTPGVRA